jgi:hypothetical protein
VLAGDDCTGSGEGSSGGVPATAPAAMGGSTAGQEAAGTSIYVSPDEGLQGLQEPLLGCVRGQGPSRGFQVLAGEGDVDRPPWVSNPAFKAATWHSGSQGCGAQWDGGEGQVAQGGQRGPWSAWGKQR